jgi:hypothetical protein
MKKIETAIKNAFTALVLLFVLGLPVLGWITLDTVETYAFHATITDKAVIDEKGSPCRYILFFVDGEEAGEMYVEPADYARHGVGDLVRVEAEVKENIFTKSQTFYTLGVDK